MVITANHSLPTEDELTVPELKLSGPALRAGAFHLGKYCQDTFNVREIFLNSFSSQTQLKPGVFCISFVRLCRCEKLCIFW